MRVGVDYRILAVGRRLIDRGMPRYTQQQLRAVLDLETDDEYVLLCNADDDLGLIDPAIRTSPNVLVRSFPGSSNPPYPQQGDPATHLRRAEEYQDWIWAQGIDLYHATTPFLLQEPVLADFDACPTVATFYDLIPLVFPGHYLRDWPARDEYLRALMFLERADRLLAISEWSARDATFYLGVPSHRIDVASPIADAPFRPLDGPGVERTLRSLRRRIRVPESFVLAVTHLHHAKNLETLLTAYALLPTALRVQLPLVLGCAFDRASEEAIREQVEGLGIADDVVLTGLVTNEELAGLYNAAVLMVHPSRYEGFGLPVIEAMQCGTPVVTTTASSLPEAAGDAAVLVDPDDPEAFADAIETVASDHDRRRDLSTRGRKRAAGFSKAQLGQRTLDCYRRAARPRRDEQAGLRPRLALWTPLPPQPSGVSEYSVDLLDALRSTVDVETFVDDGVLPDVEIQRRHRVHHFRAFERRRRQRPFDAVVYQLGTNESHLFAYRNLEVHPGVVALHDLTLSHLLYTVAVHGGDREPFRRQVSEMEGPDAVDELDAIEAADGEERERRLSEFLFRFPMLQRVVDASPAQIVHYEAARFELANRYPTARPFVVPMGIAWRRGLRPGLERVTARGRLRLAETTFVIGALGIAHPFKRLESCLDAVSRLAEAHSQVLLAVVGEVFDPSYEHHLLERAAALGIGDRVRFTGRVPRKEFDDYLMACDVIVNLRYPFMKQMSATLIRGLAAARPAVITDLPAWSGIPEECCLRVAPGDREVTDLTHCLHLLATDEPRRRRMSDAAREFFEKEATIHRMADGYLDVIATACSDTGSSLSAREPLRP